MNGWLTLDFVAKRYGKLPSEILRTGSTVDLYCSELAMGYESYLRAKEQGENAPAKQPTQSEMQAMVAKVKEQRNERKGQEK